MILGLGGWEVGRERRYGISKGENMVFVGRIILLMIVCGFSVSNHRRAVWVYDWLIFERSLLIEMS